MSRPVALTVAFAVAVVACPDKQVVESFPDSFVGVGLELKIEQELPVVVRALEGGSAAEAGVNPGDRLLAVDGIPTQGVGLGDVVMRIRGLPETQVTLTIDRGGERLIVIIRRRQMTKAGSRYQPKG